MSQINVNTPEPIERVEGSDRTAAAGINLITVLVVLAVLASIAWYLFTGPLRALGGGQTNITVNPQPSTVNVNPPPAAPAPVNSGTGNQNPGGGATNPAPGGQP